MAMNAIRQPCAAATAPPMPTPSTWPSRPPAMKAADSVARSRLGKTLTTTAMPTLP